MFVFFIMSSLKKALSQSQQLQTTILLFYISHNVLIDVGCSNVHKMHKRNQLAAASVNPGDF